MKNLKISFTLATCLLILVPLDARAMEIYYFDHPTCASAEYKGDVLEIVTKDLDDRQNAAGFIKDFVKGVKTNVENNFGANIICGGKLVPLIYTYQSNGYRYIALTMTFTGTAMKTT